MPKGLLLGGRLLVRETGIAICFFNMEKEEKRRKFHESLLNMLYPSPPSPIQQEDEGESVYVSLDGLTANHASDESEGTCSDEDDNGPPSLTRAQRKRLRRKKLKEGASRRMKFIGPLLPTPGDGINGVGGNGHVEIEPEGVRRNADEEAHATIDQLGELTACTNRHKLKRRRMAKRVAGERSMASDLGSDHQDLHRASASNS